MSPEIDAVATQLALDVREREALDTHVARLVAAQRTALQTAVDTALAQVPWVLRAAVRKVLFP